MQDSGETIHIVLSPHFDDASLSLGGLLATRGPRAIVPTFCAGVPATPLVRIWDVSCGFADSAEAMAARAKENAASLASLGVPEDSIRNYSYLDNQYRLLDEDRDEAKLIQAMADDISALLKENTGHPICVYAPGLTMIHIDHNLVKQALLRIAQDFTGAAVEFFFYQDLPYAYEFLRNTESSKSPAEWNYASIAQQAFPEGRVEQVVIELSEEAMMRKVRSVELYPSQLLPLGDDIPGLVKTFAAAQARFLGLSSPYCEVIYALRP